MISRRSLLKSAAWGTTVSSLSGLGAATENSRQTDKERLVGAHYYTWYGPDNHWSDGYVGKPRLDEYDSGSPEVILKHKQWAEQAGIDWLNTTWWGPESYSSRILENAVAPVLEGTNLEFSVLYEPRGRFDYSDSVVNFSEQAPRETLAADFKHIAETLVPNENYFTIDGRPVLYVYIARSFTGDVESAFEDAQQQAGVDFYLIGDYGRTAQLPNPAFDAVSPYNMYLPHEGVNNWFEAYVEAANQGWNLLARDDGFQFIPNTLPGFNNTQAKWATDGQPVLERSPERYEQVSELAAAYATGDPELVLITSFNEWHEFTSIEPGKEIGETYLEITDTVFSDSPWATPEIPFVPLQFEWDSYVLESSVNPDVSQSSARKLTIAVDRLTCIDGTGQQVVEYNIGSAESELIFSQGIGYASQRPERSWRWFQANRNMVSTLYLPKRVAQQTQGVILSTRALEDGFEFTLQLGDEGPPTTAQVDTGWHDVIIRLEGQETPTPTEKPDTTTRKVTSQSASPDQSSTMTGTSTEATKSASQTAVDGGGFGLFASLLATGAGSAWLLRQENQNNER